jgi:hypothetical protein
MKSRMALLVPLGLLFGGRLGDPRARRGNRGSGARKQSQAVIVGGISLEAAGRGAWLVSGSVDAVVISDRTL